MSGNLKLDASANIVSQSNPDFTVQSNGSITLDIDANNDSTNYLRVTAHNKAITLTYINENGNVGIGTASPG